MQSKAVASPLLNRYQAKSKRNISSSVSSSVQLKKRPAFLALMLFAVATQSLRTPLCIRAFVTTISSRTATAASRRTFPFVGASSSGSASATSTLGRRSSTMASASVAAATESSSILTSLTDNALWNMAQIGSHKKKLPPFAAIQADQITPAVQTLLSQLETDFAALETSLSSCSDESKPDDSTNSLDYDAVLPKLERLQHGLGLVWGVVGHLQGVLNSDDLRAAHEANQAAVVQTVSKLSQSAALYQALQTLQKDQEATTSATQSDVDKKSRERAVSIALRRMMLGGVGLADDATKQERFNDIQQRLAALSTSYSNHVLDATKAYSLTIVEKERLQGAPATALAQWAASAAQAAKAAAAAATKTDEAADTTADETITAETGPWRLTLDGPSYMAVMQHVADRDIREQIYRAYLTRASDIVTESETMKNSDNQGKDDDKTESRDNIPLVYEILALKHEMATLLGYDNYAQLSLASKMAPSIQAVTDLSELVRTTALPAAQKEWDEITAFAVQATAGTDTPLVTMAPWDVSYWSERLKESKFSLTEEETRPYFALPAVLDGMFSLVQRIFGIVVEAADGEAEVWHADVRFFKVYDTTDSDKKHVASFFLDPYARPENKRGGAWMDVCLGKSAAVDCDIPVAYLTCNGSPPISGGSSDKAQPSLMTFREVETLFHEFGHGLQHMLTTVTVGDVAGINGVEWDAVELPSQFMENWCYDRPTVYGFAKHWETGEPMPEEMFEKLKLQKTYNAGMMSCRQLQFGQLDMELHSNYDAAAGAKGEGESIFDVQRRIAQHYTPYNMPLDTDRFLCAFSHIFAGGYAAGYYSYKWAEVMSADAFSAFEEDDRGNAEGGLDNEDHVQKVGRRFRDTVLSLGGGEDPMTVFKTFRGREPRPEALLRHNGLA